MKRFGSAAVVASLIVLAACGSSPKTTGSQSTGGAQAVAPEPAIAQAQVVRVPPASASKVVLRMTGPKFVTEAKDWASFKEEWRATFAEHAKEKGIAFSMQDDDARAVGMPGTLLDVYVNDYRQVGIGARVFFGAMTGNAYIDAKVGFSDLSGGERFGEQSYNTSSSAWAGVFGKMTPQQVDSIAAEIFGSIRPR